jgi:hypothetical protein
VSNGFNILKSEWFNSCTHVDNWKGVKTSLIHYNINVGVLIITCVLINHGKCKM